MKANLIFVTSTLFTWIATLYFNCGVILEGRKTSINFLRKLRLFDCISQKDLNKKIDVNKETNFSLKIYDEQEVKI